MQTAPTTPDARHPPQEDRRHRRHFDRRRRAARQFRDREGDRRRMTRRSSSLRTSRSQEPIITINCFVVHTGGKCVLIDSGAGNNSMFAAGALPAALNAAGVSPDTVDTILMSHLHPDHAGGLTAEDGRAVFPNAELLLHEDEAKFWLETKQPARRHEALFRGRADGGEAVQVAHAHLRQGPRSRRASSRSRYPATRPGTPASTSPPATSRC